MINIKKIYLSTNSPINLIATENLNYIQNKFESNYIIPKELGLGEVKLSNIREGLYLGMINHICSQKLNIEIELPTDCVQFLFITSGDFTIKSSQKINQYSKVKKTLDLIIENHNPVVKYDLKMDYHNSLLFIYIKTSLLSALINECEIFFPNDVNTIMFKQQVYISSFTPSIQLIIQDIYKIPKESPLKKILYESKILELIALMIKHYLIKKREKKSTLTSYDIEKLNNAKKILIKDMTNPPSVLQLSKQVGLNDFKLKKGFKELFDNTIYGFLKERRMEKARHLLQSKEMNVTEVSFEVGYNSLSHFVTEFKKYYGLSPGKIIATEHHI